MTSIALYALVLNAVWEYAQLVPLYTCWTRWSRWQKLLCPPAAIVGDVMIVLGVSWITGQLTGTGALIPQGWAGWTLLLAASFAASLFFEWVARRLDLWRYKSAMPTLSVAGETIGLAPVLQISLLPAASLLLAQAIPL
jgi:hypothetical protein